MHKLKTSAGLLVFRETPEKGREYLLVHPSGSYNQTAPYYIPKGQPNPEDTSLEETAVRETLEETGVIAKTLFPLGSIKYVTGTKEVHAFLAELQSGNVSETGEVEHDDWENDDKRFFPVEEARNVIRPEMVAFIERAEKLLESR